MNSIAMDDIKQISKLRNHNSLSFYIPTHRAGSETGQARIQLKNLLTEAEALLRERGMGPAAIQTYLKPVIELENNSRFWSFQSDGLAIFLSDSLFKSYRLPLHFDAQVHAGERFYLSPLFGFLNTHSRFYILALSKGDARLIECSQFGSRRVEVEDLPAGLDAFLGEEDKEKQLQFHTSAPSTGQSGRAAIFHGHGAASDTDDVKMVQYLRQLDKAVTSVLNGQNAALILACVKEHAAVYRYLSTHRNILDETLSGNPDRRKDEDLREEAWPIVAGLFKKERMKIVNFFRQVEGTGRTSRNIAEIISAARTGKVENLMLAGNVKLWGSVDAETSNIEVHPERRDDSIELVDEAAIYTIESGGSVYVTEDGDLPEDIEVAAVYRY